METHNEVMGGNEIELIKKAENKVLALLEEVREEGEKEINDAKREAEVLILKKESEAGETVQEMIERAEKAAVVEAGVIRERGEREAERIREESRRKIPEAADYIVRSVTGGMERGG